MYVIIQLICFLLAVICIGQAVKNGSTKFDKISFSIFSLLFVLLTVFIEGVLK